MTDQTNVPADVPADAAPDDPDQLPDDAAIAELTAALAAEDGPEAHDPAAD